MCLAIPGRVIEITGESDLARVGRVDFGGVIREVSLTCLPDARIGQHVLVHAGLAISVIDEAEAARVLDLLRQMGEAEIDTDAVTSGREKS